MCSPYPHSTHTTCCKLFFRVPRLFFSTSSDALAHEASLGQNRTYRARHISWPCYRLKTIPISISTSRTSCRDLACRYGAFTTSVHTLVTCIHRSQGPSQGSSRCEQKWKRCERRRFLIRNGVINRDSLPRTCSPL